MKNTGNANMLEDGCGLHYCCPTGGPWIAVPDAGPKHRSSHISNVFKLDVRLRIRRSSSATAVHH